MSRQMHRPGVFRSGAERQAFHAAYRAVLERWPGASTRDVPTRYGSTRVTSSGPYDAPAVVLLSGQRSTSMVWYRLAEEAARSGLPVRLLAPDRVGDAGMSRHDGLPLESRDDLVDWLDDTLDGCGVDRAVLVGHGYGAWVSLSYALSLPARLSRLVLVDPTDCFAPLSGFYRARHLPVVVRSDAGAARRLLAWETSGRSDPLWGELYVRAAGFPVSRPVWPHRFDRSSLAALRVPTDVVVAAWSRAHDALAVERGASVVPAARVELLAGVSHLTAPLAGAPRLARLAVPSLV